MADMAEAIRLYRDHSAPPVALLIGAGVDRALAGRPLWTGLISDVAAQASLDPSEVDTLRHFALSNPEAAAEALRTRLGGQRFVNSLSVVMRRHHYGDGPMAHALQALVNAGIRLIVTFNYSRDVIQALASCQLDILIIDRVHLASLPTSEILRPPVGRLHLVALHGTVDSLERYANDVILARQDYSEAIFGSPFYLSFLRTLFRECHTLSLGLSWGDSVLRESAAEAKYLAFSHHRMHLDLKKMPDDTAGDLEARWEENGRIGAYGVRPIFCNTYADLPKRLTEIAKLGWRSAPTADDHPRKIADYLDACGDYEASMQQLWFQEHRDRIKTLLKTSSLEDAESLARIERHFRHFSFIYESPKEMPKERRDVWNAVAQRLETAGFDLEKRARSGERWILEFGLGAWETGSRTRLGGKWKQALASLGSAGQDNTRLRRATIASQVWPKARSFAALRDRAQEMGWEAIDAKLALDQCEASLINIRAANHGSRAVAPRFLALADRARTDELARDALHAALVAGCKRRMSGATILRSLVMDTAAAEIALLSLVRASSRPNQSESADPLAMWNTYVGLLAVLVDSARHAPSASRARLWLEDRCGPVARAGLQYGLGQVVEEYWSRYHPQAAHLARSVADEVLADPGGAR